MHDASGLEKSSRPAFQLKARIVQSPFRVVCHEVSPVQTAMRNCTRDEGRSFEAGSQVLASNRCKLLSSRAMVVSVAVNVGRISRRVRLREASASEPSMNCRKRFRRCQNRGGDASSGISSEDVLIPTERHPACRQREARPGSRKKLTCSGHATNSRRYRDFHSLRVGNAGGRLVWNVRTWPAMAREKAQAAPTARPKVPMRRRGADCLVVVRHRLCRPTANETLVSHCRVIGIELRGEFVSL